MYESKSERIIEIGPHCHSYLKNKSGTFFMAHGIFTSILFWQIMTNQSL